MKAIALAIVTLGLTYCGFYYDSGWAFVGAIISLISLTDLKE